MIKHIYKGLQNQWIRCRHNIQVTRLERTDKGTYSTLSNNENLKGIQWIGLMDLRLVNKISYNRNIYGDNLLAVFPNLNVTGLVKTAIETKNSEF